MSETRRICPLCRSTPMEPTEAYCGRCEETLEAEREELRCEWIAAVDRNAERIATTPGEYGTPARDDEG
jgi:predicted nucleic acid-binding Zn ribbon protein